MVPDIGLSEMSALMAIEMVCRYYNNGERHFDTHRYCYTEILIYKLLMSGF